jgi:hypothetical protein
MKRFWLTDVCACALYLMLPFPVWWMASTLDEHEIGLLLGLPAIAVALAATLGQFVLAEKARHIGEHARRRLREQQDEGR